jgi:uncharacterized protein YbjT (DUF2867 family)
MFALADVPESICPLWRLEMKILVLGATGATGRLIVGEAMAKGYEVVALIRSKAKSADLAGAELVEGDARDAAALTGAIAGCDAVVSSLGTAMSPFREVPDTAEAPKADRYIYFSSAAIIP